MKSIENSENIGKWVKRPYFDMLWKYICPVTGFKAEFGFDGNNDKPLTDMLSKPLHPDFLFHANENYVRIIENRTTKALWDYRDGTLKIVFTDSINNIKMVEGSYGLSQAMKMAFLILAQKARREHVSVSK